MKRSRRESWLTNRELEPADNDRLVNGSDYDRNSARQTGGAREGERMRNQLKPSVTGVSGCEKSAWEKQRLDPILFV